MAGHLNVTLSVHPGALRLDDFDALEEAAEALAVTHPDVAEQLLDMRERLRLHLWLHQTADEDFAP